MLGDETHHEPGSTSYVSYGMFGNPIHDTVFFAEMEFDPNTMPGGIPISFHAERFGSTSHITPSIPMVEATSHVRPRPSVSNPIRIPEPTRVTVGNTTYIISHVPSSSIPCSSNAFPPPHSRGPLGRNVATSHVRTAATRPVVSHTQVPPVVSGGRIPTSGGHVITSGAYIPTYGVSHGTSHGMSYGPYYRPQYAQTYSPYG